MKVLHIAETIRGGIASYLNELHPQQQASFGADNVHYVVPSDHRRDLGAIDDNQITTSERAASAGRSTSPAKEECRCTTSGRKASRACMLARSIWNNPEMLRPDRSNVVI